MVLDLKEHEMVRVDATPSLPFFYPPLAARKLPLNARGFPADLGIQKDTPQYQYIKVLSKDLWKPAATSASLIISKEEVFIFPTASIRDPGAAPWFGVH